MSDKKAKETRSRKPSSSHRRHQRHHREHHNRRSSRSRSRSRSRAQSPSTRLDARRCARSSRSRTRSRSVARDSNRSTKDHATASLRKLSNGSADSYASSSSSNSVSSPPHRSNRSTSRSRATTRRHRHGARHDHRDGHASRDRPSGSRRKEDKSRSRRRKDSDCDSHRAHRDRRRGGSSSRSHPHHRHRSRSACRSRKHSDQSTSKRQRSSSPHHQQTSKRKRHHRSSSVAKSPTTRKKPAQDQSNHTSNGIGNGIDTSTTKSSNSDAKKQESGKNQVEKSKSAQPATKTTDKIEAQTPPDGSMTSHSSSQLKQTGSKPPENSATEPSSSPHAAKDEHTSSIQAEKAFTEQEQSPVDDPSKAQDDFSFSSKPNDKSRSQSNGSAASSVQSRGAMVGSSASSTGVSDAMPSTCGVATTKSSGEASNYVSAIKLDILKALAEARTTIAEIKGVTDFNSPDKATNGQTNGILEQVPLGSEPVDHEDPHVSKQPEEEKCSAPIDHFDMFALDEDTHPDAKEQVVPEPSTMVLTAPQSNCDDADGYYKTAVGEILNDKYRVLGVVGKGVFSTVLRCQQQGIDQLAGSTSGSIVAIKLIRNNDTMREAAQTEVRLLRELADKDPRDKRHVIRLLDVFDHCNHVALVFEPMQMNLREAMKKFGGKGGISIQAVRVFCKHLLIALNHLDTCGIVHADIKPDNILLDDKQTMVKLCDFGSAFKLEGGQHDPTPYLVSRFYRAPEIVLGLAYDKAVDMWSVGCCLFEMFTGKVLFPGGTNNEMLKCFMQLKGKIPNKIIKKHRAAYLDQLEKEPHFTDDLKFCSREIDCVTGKPVLRLMDVVKNKMDLGNALLSAKSKKDDRKQVLELRNLLEKMFMIDPAKRISVKEALAHAFVKSN